MKRLSLVLLLAACEAPAPATPIVSVLKRTETCFALLTPDIAPDPVLGIPAVCVDPGEPTLAANVDLVELVIDYGPDVDFARSTTVPPPSVVVTADGKPVEVAVDVSAEQRAGTRAFFVATLRAPDVASNDVRFTAGVEQGFATTVPVVFTVLPPAIALDLAECIAGMACDLIAAVGVVHATVTIPGDVSLPVAIHQAIDGAVAPDPVPALTTMVSTNQNRAAVSIPLPPVGASWRLVAQVGRGASAPIDIALHAPAITSALSCGTSCTIAPGTEVGLAITAPPGIEATTARVTTRLDGVPQLVDQLVALEVDGTGLATLIAPSRAGTWQIDATVAGFAAPALTARVQ